MLFEDVQGQCPFCFSLIHIPIDPGSGQSQDTIVDCEVCCRPIEVKAQWLEESQEYSIQLERSN